MAESRRSGVWPPATGDRHPHQEGVITMRMNTKPLSLPLPMKKDPCNFGSGYFNEALFDLDRTIEYAVYALRDKTFDTIVGTGMSGAVIVPSLAREMDKEFLIVRKPNDDSHHGGALIGRLGRRWIFVDDFVSTGRTRQRVLDAMENACGFYCGNGSKQTDHRRAMFMGEYQYGQHTWLNATQVRSSQRRLREYANY